MKVWSEIHMKDRSPEGAVFNYRLDYVLRSADPASPPVIVEVMTCSTSGGNKAKGTDMANAFRSAVLFANRIIENVPASPGVNVRQVWARMASQMIAKSEAAIAWGGHAIWVVQDLLADYIKTQTALPLDELRSEDWSRGEVNLVVSNLADDLTLYSGPIRSPGSSRRSWMEILGAAHIPVLESLQKKLDDKPPLAVFVAS